jgi:hypothetical protein
VIVTSPGPLSAQFGELALPVMQAQVGVAQQLAMMALQ